MVVRWGCEGREVVLNSGRVIRRGSLVRLYQWGSPVSRVVSFVGQSLVCFLGGSFVYMREIEEVLCD